MDTNIFFILIVFAIPLLSVGRIPKSIRHQQIPSAYTKRWSPPFSRTLLFKDAQFPVKTTSLAATIRSTNFNTSEDLLFDANIPEYARKELWLRDEKLSELNLQLSEKSSELKLQLSELKAEKKSEILELKLKLSEEQKKTAEYFNSLQNAIKANCFANPRSIIGEYFL
jgi:hypothetical protein